MDVVYYVACSLDGFIATKDGGVDWLNPYNSSESGYADFYASIDALVMGSHTYEFALDQGDWPSADKPTWVFTHRDLPVADPSVTLTDDDPKDVVDTLRTEGHERVWLMGGGELASSFRTQGLVSHYMIWIIPVILGAGIPLFSVGAGMDSLRLVESKSLSNGVVLLSYQQDVKP